MDFGHANRVGNTLRSPSSTRQAAKRLQADIVHRRGIRVWDDILGQTRFGRCEPVYITSSQQLSVL